MFKDIVPSSHTMILFLAKSASVHSEICFTSLVFFTNLIAIFQSFSTMLFFSFSSVEHSAIGFNSFHFSSIFKYMIESCSTMLYFIFSSSEHSERIFIVSSSFVTSTKTIPPFSKILCDFFSVELHSESGFRCST
jgi:hypothetical protein